jgi:hypothetical protein
LNEHDCPYPSCLRCSGRASGSPSSSLCSCSIPKLCVCMWVHTLFLNL